MHSAQIDYLTHKGPLVEFENFEEARQEQILAYTNLLETAICEGQTRDVQELVRRLKVWTDAIQQPPAEEPVDAAWPALNTDNFPPLLKRFMTAACKDSEADPAAVAATFIIHFGIQCGASAYVSIGESKHHTRTNAVIVGASSKARKGTSAGPVKSVFLNIDSPCLTSPGPLSSGEGLIYAVRDEQKAYVTDRKTGVGSWQTVDPGVTDKRLFVLDEELGAALAATKREGNTLSAIVRGLFDDGNAAPLTKGNRIATTAAHIGILSHITQAELKVRLSESEQLNGFGNRILWVCAKRQKLCPFPEPMDASEKAAIVADLQSALDEAYKGGQYIFSQEAKQLWASEYSRLSMAHKGLAGAMINRAEAHVVRLALIFALMNRHPGIIEADDLQGALDFWSYCQQSAQYLFGSEQADHRKQKILTALNTLNAPSLSKNEIRDKVFSRHISSAELNNIIKEMSDEHLIEVIEEKTAGAPRTIVVLKNT